MKKKSIRGIAAVITMVILLPLAIGVGLVEAASILSSSSISLSSMAYVKFFNVRDEETVLYVQKKVEADPLYPAPEGTEFTFVLKLNDTVVRNQQYSLYDAEGRKIYNYPSGQTTTEDPSQLEVALKTDRYGQFTLTDGQMARFEGLSPGDSYEVSEIDVPVEFEQILPAGGASEVGTLTDDGAIASFTNLYESLLPPPGGDVSTLKVYKRISYPKNYEIPETPEFTFRLKIAGALYGNMPYSVMDIDTDAEISTAETDSEGQFTLKGNTYAFFDGVPTEMDYEVEELITDETAAEGWRVVGNGKSAGATSSAGTIVNFTNAMASFAVSKEMYGGISVGETFEFQLLGESENPRTEAVSYYLYDKNLQLVDEELHQTGTDGSFTLKDGQRAVFVGLPVGTVYGVRETGSGEYIQYLPTTEKGYTNKTVKDAVEVLPFINAEVPYETLLTVKKTVVNNSKESTVPDAEFSFRITKLVDGEYVPVAKAAYDIINASGTSTYRADEDGVFKLKAWQTARFVELEENVTYRVEELTDGLPAEFVIGGEPAKEGLLTDEVLEMEFENNYKGPADPYVAIRKVMEVTTEEDGTEVTAEYPVPDAKLRLIRKDGEEEVIIHEWVSKDTPEEFQVEPGTYYIREVEVPDGYLKADDVEIVVKKTKTVQEYKMVDEQEPSETDLPQAGGSGTKRYYLIGIALIAAAAAALFVYYRKRKTHGA